MQSNQIVEYVLWREEYEKKVKIKIQNRKTVETHMNI